MKNTILIYKNFNNISKIAEAISEIGENIFISTALKNGLQFLKFERVDLFIIDGSYPVETKELISLKDRNIELIFIDRAELTTDIIGFGKLVKEDQFIQYLKNIDSKNSVDYNSTSLKKSPRIFRDFETFKLSITQEVRRAKRYRYPFVVVMFHLIDSNYRQEIISYFSSKIREFDSIWIYNDEMFSMVLPHTGWNGAEILTNRLTVSITKKLGIEIDSLKNIILSFKRIERDKDFIYRIEQALNGTYYNINKSVDFNVWKEELFSEFLEAKTIRIFNRYKGLLISHDSDILLKDQILKLHNIRNTQLAMIDSEKATYFHSKTLNKTIRAGVDTVDRENMSATLSNFEIINSDFIKSTGVKLLVEEDLPATIFDADIQIPVKIVELSLDEITIIVKDISIFENSLNIRLSFSIPFQNNFYKITADSTVINIEKGTDISYIDMKISTSINDNMKISEFLSNKQIQFIKELKNISSLEI